MKPIIYVKDNISALIDENNKFIYEVSIFISYKNIYHLHSTELFSSDIEIKSIIESYNIDKNITINCKLYAAPKEWLVNNKFTIWSKPEKKKRKKKNDVEQKIITN